MAHYFSENELMRKCPAAWQISDIAKIESTPSQTWLFSFVRQDDDNSKLFYADYTLANDPTGHLSFTCELRAFSRPEYSYKIIQKVYSGQE